MTSCLALPDLAAMRGPSSVASAMRPVSGLPATSPLSRDGSSSGRCGLPPFHAERRCPGIRVYALAGAAKPFAFIEGERPRIVGVDVEQEKSGREAFGFAHECLGNPRSERIGVHGDLIEPSADAVEDHEAGQISGLIARGERGAALRLKQREMLGKPIAARLEINGGISRSPGSEAQLDELDRK